MSELERVNVCLDPWERAMGEFAFAHGLVEANKATYVVGVVVVGKQEADGCWRCVVAEEVELCCLRP